jgi:glycerol-3-phosphate dehydrogenase (NAD(P)+)
MPPKPERIAVLGAGSWGATLAGVLAENGHAVSLWEFDAAAAQALAATRTLKVLPDLRLPKSVEVTHDLKRALTDRPVVLSVTPSEFVRSTMKAVQATDALSPKAVIISASKGLEEKSLKRMSEIILQEVGGTLDRIAILSGPSHAEEVCRHLPTAVVSASQNVDLARRVQAMFTQEFFRVYAHSDMLGVELGGTLKNVLAIGCGISDGLGFGDNTKALIMTRGLNELSRLGVKMGADLLTFFGLTGMGDLIVTCLSQHSRNRLFGEKIGQGKTPAQALKEMTMVTEGYKTSAAAFELAKSLKIECPLFHEIYQILYQGKNPKASMHDLMERETPAEWRDVGNLPKGGHTS